MKNWFIKHREVLAYLVFGVLTTLLNIVLYALFSRLFGYEAANSWGNVLDNVICILFAAGKVDAHKERSQPISVTLSLRVECSLTAHIQS